MQHAVYVRDDAPVHQKPYWIPYSQREAVKEELDKMLVENTIWPLTSPWASPMVLGPKKDGGVQFCMDYHKMNQVATFSAYPMP